MSEALRTETVSFGANGQVVIPRWLRREFQFKAGTWVRVHAQSGVLVLKPLTRAYIKSLRGSIKGAGTLKALMDDRRREREL